MSDDFDEQELADMHEIELREENEKLRAAFVGIRDFLTHPEWGTSYYLDEVINRVNAALGDRGKSA